MASCRSADRQARNVVAVLPVAGLGNVVIAAKQTGIIAEEGVDLGFLPDEKLAFFTFAVGILGGVEATLPDASFRV